MLLLAWLLSFGPGPSLAGFSPYRLLMNWYPGFAQTRSAFRFAFFVQLNVAFLAALGLCGISRFLWLSKRFTPKQGRLAALAVTAAIGILAAFECVPVRQRLFRVPACDTRSGWIPWLERTTEKNAIIACLPFPESRKVSAFQETTAWMYFGTFHRRRMVNGYSGFFPKSYLRLQDLMQGFPDQNSLRQLREHQVGYCVVRQGVFPEGMNESPELEHVYHDAEARVDIYRLR
jgi:hypothetical protein